MVSKSKALFLDRDGVINVDLKYVYKIEDIKFLDGIFEFVHYFYSLGYIPLVVTNQSGIGRGFFTEKDFLILMDWIHKIFEKKGCPIIETFFCPHHPEAKINKFKKNCFCRKPSPGMIIKASQKYNLDLENSILIGDNFSDIEAAKLAGIKYYYKIEPDNSSKYFQKIKSNFIN